MNIVDLIEAQGAAHPEKNAIIENGRRTTYRELLTFTADMAGYLSSAGVAPSQRIGLRCEDSTDYIVTSLAVLTHGAVIVPIAPALSATEVATLVERMDLHYMISENEPLGSEGAPTRIPERFCSKELFVTRRRATTSLSATYAAMHPAFIRFSSGTTGTRKGVLLSHETIIERTAAANHALRITNDDVVLWVLSMSYHFVVSILLFLRQGATTVICHQPFPDSFLGAMQTCSGTFIYASPFHYRVLTMAKEFTEEVLRPVRLFVSTAMHVTAADAQAFAQKFNRELASAYGIIEAGLPCVNTSADPRKRTSVGRILPDYQLRIDRPDADGVGEILVAGKGMFDAYVSPWRTRDACMPDGWFRTGDLGAMDSDGFLFIVGRNKDVINLAGMKIFPYEVEEVINRHPDVAESVVYGVPHPHYGQIPHARIVLKNTAGRHELSLSQLRRYCYVHLAPHEVPKQFEVVDRIEKTASDKIVRHNP